MSFMRLTAGVAILNNRLYVCGGRDGSACHRSVESYDPHTNKWTLRTPMVRRRSGVAVGVLNNFLYALGGFDNPANNSSVCRTETVERYDPTTDTWTMVSKFKSTTNPRPQILIKIETFPKISLCSKIRLPRLALDVMQLVLHCWETVYLPLVGTMVNNIRKLLKNTMQKRMNGCR